MAAAIIQHLEGEPDHFPIGDLQSALSGPEGPATATTWAFSLGDRKIVFTGTFNVVGGFVQSGTMTGFELFKGAVKIMTGSGYSLSASQILAAHDAAVADDYTIFYGTFFKEVQEIGSGESDHMYGSTVSGKFLGEGGDDFLFGGPGNELMKGGLGDDWLEGRGKEDKLFGNEGADTFAFTNADKNNGLGDDNAIHRVKGFSVAEDTIFLDVGRFAALGPGPLDTTEFGIGRKAGSPDEHVFYRKKTGDLYYDEDGNGAIKKVLIAELDSGLKLKAHHFEADFVA